MAAPTQSTLYVSSPAQYAADLTYAQDRLAEAPEPNQAQKKATLSTLQKVAIAAVAAILVAGIVISFIFCPIFPALVITGVAVGSLIVIAASAMKHSGVVLFRQRRRHVPARIWNTQAYWTAANLEAIPSDRSPPRVRFGSVPKYSSRLHSPSKVVVKLESSLRGQHHVQAGGGDIYSTSRTVPGPRALGLRTVVGSR